ncbi:MAG TPA: GAF domain-containing protein, partial [Anaerolineae bacterium]|nr:GAF domain-containing protein [Anaerolineae bacterium]
KMGSSGLIVSGLALTPFDVWLGQSLIFCLAALLLGLADRGLRLALRAARVSEMALQQRTQELEQERSALRISEERYRNFIEQSVEGIWLLEFERPIPIDLPSLEQVHLIHHTGHIVECNETLAKLYGYESRQEILGKRLFDLYSGSITEEHRQAMLALIKSDYRSRNHETIETNRQGEPVYFLNNAVGVIRAGGVVAIWGMQRDVTDRKLIEQMLARRARYLQTGAEVSRAVASILDLSELLPRIVDLLQTGFDLYYAGLFLIDDSGRQAVLRAATGEPGRQLLQADFQLPVNDQSMIGWCMRHGQARLALDVGEDPVHFINPVLPATRSEIALPLISWGRAIGAITIQSGRPGAFTTDDAAVLQTMADQVAIAINNAQLFETEKRNAALMLALRDIGLDLSAQLDLSTLLQTIVKRAAQLLGAPMGELLLMQPDGASLREAALFKATSYPTDIRLGEGVTGRVAQTGEPLIIADYGQWPGRIQALAAANYRSVVGVPVQWRSRVLGVLNVLDDRPAQFTQDDASVLQLFAVQAAIAIENARLFEAAWRRVSELNVLHEVALAASQAVDEKELIARVMEVLGGTLNIDYLGALLKDEALNALRIDTYFQGAHLTLSDELIPLGRGITGTVALTGQARRLDDVRHAPGYYQYHADALSEVCVPLKVGDHILGVINAESRQLAAFSEADEQLLSTVAGQLGTAIDRLRTEAARRQNEEELAQERNLLRTLIDNLSDTHIFVKDTHSRFITTNAEHLRTLGLTELDQVVGKTDFDFFEHADAEQYYADEQVAMRTGEPMLGHIEKIHDASGQLRWYLSNKMPLRDKDGKIIGLVGASVNITERQRAAERERAIARGLQAVVAAADEILQIDDLDLFYRRVVELAREKLNVERCGVFLLDAERQFLLGTYGTDLQGGTTDERGVKLPVAEQLDLFTRGVRRVVVPLAQHGYWGQGSFQSMGSGWVALTLIGSGAEPIGVFSNDTAISRVPLDEVQQESLTLYCSLLGNIVIRKRVAQEREALINELEAKNAELERFTYTVSHDLKAPLITIRGFMGLLMKDAAAGDLDRMQADLARISQATDRMQRLLNELLELSRVGRLANAPERVSLESIAREAVSLVEGRLSARGVRVEIAPHLPEVFVDRARLVEVMQNLVDNAVKFMGNQTEPRIEIGVRGEVNRRVFFVHDNGLGIEPRYHDKVFGLFDKLDPKSEGTGIGLALVKRIIEVHGGRVWVESAGLGQGSTFCFTLPMPG